MVYAKVIHTTCSGSVARALAKLSALRAPRGVPIDPGAGVLATPRTPQIVYKGSQCQHYMFDLQIDMC